MDAVDPQSDTIANASEETKPDEGFDSDALEKTTADRMAEVFKNADESDLTDGTLDDDQIVKEEDEVKDEIKDEIKDEVKDEIKDEVKDEDDDKALKDAEKALEEATKDEASEAVSEDEESTLPEAYRRSLKSRGWDDEEIDRFYKADTGLAMKTFERIHDSRSEEIARFAELGRRSRPQQTSDRTEVDTGKQAITEVQSSRALKPIDTEAMVEKYGNPDLVKEIVGPVNATIEQLNHVLPELRESVSTIRQSRQETLAQQIEGFFGGEELKSFKPVYGAVTDATLTEEQVKNRGAVLEMADAIVAGAVLQGRELSVNEALLMAHDSVASNFKEQEIRTTIKKKIKKRAASVSVRPNTQRTRDSSASPRTRNELERNAEEGLAKVFSKS